MLKKIIYDSDMQVDYENLPDDSILYFYNNMLTLSGIPKNYILINDPNPPITTIVEEKNETTSLIV